MTFFESISTCFKKYSDFDGRASRSEYWWFALFIILGDILFSISNSCESMSFSEILYIIFNLIVLLPSLAVGARRLHDTGKSGWWQLIGLIPIAGAIVLIVFFAQKPQDGDNQYGHEIALS
ncbi:MAG: DUF805 domain-containing protein [Sulfurovaceae bacterium]|nr:DUF805 domain-containing protein [Sulfurovaceae bacterium]